MGELSRTFEKYRKYTPGSDVGLAIAVILLLGVLVIPLPPTLLDVGLALSVTSSVLVLMVSLFIKRPLDFTSFPLLLLVTTLLRLSLNVATTRLILSHGHEGPDAAGHVVAAFGGFLMGGDVVIGLILFSILLIVNFMVITKGSGRIAEVAARFSLDAMPGKQMAIDADLSAGMISEGEARRRRKELEEESGFYGTMDGAAKFVRGDAIAGLIITFINILGGLAIGVMRHGLPFGEAAQTFTALTAGDGLVSQIPALLISVAAGIVVTKGGTEGSADTAMVRQLGASPKPLAIASGTAVILAMAPGVPMLPFLTLAALCGAGAWYRHKHEQRIDDEVDEAPVLESAPSEPTAADLARVDQIRVELGYGLLSMATGEAAQLSEQIRATRRSFAQDMGFMLPVVRIQDNMQLEPNAYSIKIKEIEVGRGEMKPGMLLALDPRGGMPELSGEPTTEPAFGLPAMWIPEIMRVEAQGRGYTVVDLHSVITTHLTELVRDSLSELLSYGEVQKMLDDLPAEYRKLLNEIVPSQTNVGSIQRVLQGLLSERISIRDLPTILEGIQEACAAGFRSLTHIISHVRVRIARQICESCTDAGHGFIPLLTLSSDWERELSGALTGGTEDRQLAMDPTRLSEFMRSLKKGIEEAVNGGYEPAVLVSAALRSHLRAVVERIRPATHVLSQSEMHARARIRVVGTVG